MELKSINAFSLLKNKIENNINDIIYIIKIR